MRKKIVRYEASVNSSLDDLKLHPVLKQVYLNRGIQAPDELEKDLAQLLPYQKLSGIEQAVECLFIALSKQQRILIVGDYDVDGATSTALMIRVLSCFGAKQVDFLVPNRFAYGYGLSPEIIELAAKRNPDLIITVDNGIASIQGVERAKQLGIKVVITDHHLPGIDLPAAAAIVNPSLLDDQFPSKNLAGVGVAFYVLLALRVKLRAENWFVTNKLKEPNMANFLDLVALGTIADVVSLDKNNRILVHQGLKRIRANKCCAGIKALLAIARCKQSTVASSDLSFGVGPRLNATGRLDDMSPGILCLLTDSNSEAQKIASELNDLNQERRIIERDMRIEALEILDKLHLADNKKMPLGLCLHSEKWHEGVVGILASRLKERFHRPVIVFASKENGELKGSGRSVPGLHMRDVLENIAISNPDLITKFGGHAMAAGLTLKKDSYTKFAAIFASIVDDYLAVGDLQNEIKSDGQLVVADLTLELAEMLRQVEPWGQDFHEPVFDGIFYILEQHIVGQRHLKLTLEADDKQFEAIAFNVDRKLWPNDRCEKIHAAYRVGVNEYRGWKKLQLVLDYLVGI
jgi:single-stranded-DNA-specific exonuclease